jgi:transcription initiation factor TFIIIB Brf1 subunit/transcription initiation factor TFIIB
VKGRERDHILTKNFKSKEGKRVELTLISRDNNKKRIERDKEYGRDKFEGDKEKRGEAVKEEKIGDETLGTMKGRRK